MDDIDYFFDTYLANKDKYHLTFRHYSDYKGETLRVWSKDKQIVTRSADNFMDSHDMIFRMAAKDLEDWIARAAGVKN